MRDKELQIQFYTGLSIPKGGIMRYFVEDNRMIPDPIFTERRIRPNLNLNPKTELLTEVAELQEAANRFKAPVTVPVRTVRVEFSAVGGADKDNLLLERLEAIAIDYGMRLEIILDGGSRFKTEKITVSPVNNHENAKSWADRLSSFKAQHPSSERMVEL